MSIGNILSILVAGFLILSGYRVHKLQKVMMRETCSGSELKRTILNSGYSNLALLIASLVLFGVTCLNSKEICVIIISGVFFIANLITIIFQIRLIIKVKNFNV